VRELIFDLGLREADSSNEFVGHIDYRPQGYINALALLEVLKLWLLELAFVASDEQRSYMVCVRVLPQVHSLLLSNHQLKVINHFFVLFCLLKRTDQRSLQVAPVIRVRFNRDAQEDWTLSFRVVFLRS